MILVISLLQFIEFDPNSLFRVRHICDLRWTHTILLRGSVQVEVHDLSPHQGFHATVDCLVTSFLFALVQTGLKLLIALGDLHIHASP